MEPTLWGRVQIVCSALHHHFKPTSCPLCLNSNKPEGLLQVRSSAWDQFLLLSFISSLHSCYLHLTHLQALFLGLLSRGSLTGKSPSQNMLPSNLTLYSTQGSTVGIYQCLLLKAVSCRKLGFGYTMFITSVS